ncbi:MAG TPA: methyltransferase [Pseudonocardiaceae bacterium]|nr:methyltransferase [Pseudonocardiaceae bacterium]
MTGWPAAGLAGLLFALTYLLVVFVIQPLLLRRRTGRSAWLPSLGANRAERTANVIFLEACGLELANPSLALAGIRPMGIVLPPAVIALSALLFLGALILAVIAQRTMGDAWQTGINPQFTAPLVVHGPFRLVRNPTYTSLLANGLAVGLLVPTALAAAAVLVCLAALQIQTRLVEEPHLKRLHQRAYSEYTARVGRFLPLIGRSCTPG